MTQATTHPIREYKNFDVWAKQQGFHLIVSTDIDSSRPESVYRHMYAHRRNRLIMAVIADESYDMVLEVHLWGSLVRKPDATQAQVDALLYHSHRHASEDDVIRFEAQGANINPFVNANRTFNYVVWDPKRYQILPVLKNSLWDHAPVDPASRWKEFIEDCPKWVQNFLCGKNLAHENLVLDVNLDNGETVINVNYDPDPSASDWTIQQILPLYRTEITKRFRSPMDDEKLGRIEQWMHQVIQIVPDDANPDRMDDLVNRVRQTILAHVGRVALAYDQSPI